MVYAGAGLDVKSPCRFKYLNVWCPVGGTVWKGLGGMTLLEEVCHSGWGLKFQKPMPGPVSVSLPALTDQDVKVSVTAPAPFVCFSP